MIDPDHPRLPVVRQCTLVALSRSTYYYAPRGENAFNRQVMRCIDEQFLATPWSIRIFSAISRWIGRIRWGART